MRGKICVLLGQSIKKPVAAVTTFTSGPVWASTCIFVLCCAVLPQVGAAEEMSFAPQQIQATKPESGEMKAALADYNKGLYFDATRKLHNVVEGTTNDGENTKRKAEFWLGKSLYKLGYFSSSFGYFDRVVQAGNGHPYYEKTLKWLAGLSHKLPQSFGILELIGKYDEGSVADPEVADVRDELSYLLGKFKYSKGDFKSAIALFRQVPANSPYANRAKFMEGTAYVRDYQAKPAATAFKELLRRGEEGKQSDDSRYFVELANLSLARVFYATGQHELSVKYYHKIPRWSTRWPEALFESSWSHYMLDEFDFALGNIHSVNSSYFANYYYPESMILKAVIYWKNCMYDEAHAAINEFNGRFSRVRGNIDDVFNKYQDPSDFFELAQKVRAGKLRKNDDVTTLIQSTLADMEVERSFIYVDEIELELENLKKAPKAWKAAPIASTILQDLSLQKSLAINNAGELSQSRLKRLSREIAELQKQAFTVEYETLNGEKNTLNSSLRNEQVIDSPDRRKKRAKIHDDYYIWKFKGEYWRDEIGFYRVPIRSQCTR